MRSRHAADAPGRIRRFVTWVFRNREEIDQKGLLAGRTLRVGPRRAKRDDEG